MNIEYLAFVLCGIHIIYLNNINYVYRGFYVATIGKTSFKWSRIYCSGTENVLTKLFYL